jgi:hypothetical protein
MIGNANMISKVYFPRLVISTSTVIVSFVDFLIPFAQEKDFISRLEKINFKNVILIEKPEPWP